MPPLVTIFVMSYNHAAYLRDCLDSILALRGGYELEIILIDDASPDATPEIVRSYVDPRLKYIRHETNRGSTASANEGFSLARGEFVARIDSDDRYRPDFLERAVPILQAHPKVGLVYGDIAMIGPGGQIHSGRHNLRRGTRPVQGNELLPLLEENYVPAPGSLFRREALLPLLPIPGHLRFIDWYLTLGVAEEWDFHFVDEVQADYRIHTSNMHRTMIGDRTGEAAGLWMIENSLARPGRAEEKRRNRARILAAHYLTYAEKYFGYEMNADARRCYRAAFRHRPGLMLNPGVARRFLATFVSRQRYDQVKRWLRHPAPSASGSH